MRWRSLFLRINLLATFAVAACTTTRLAAPRYLLPYPVGTSFLLLQGNNGPWGHEGKAAFAFDFKMPIGSKVTAARDGVVVKVEGRRERWGQSCIVVLSADGAAAAG